MEVQQTAEGLKLIFATFNLLPFLFQILRLKGKSIQYLESKKRNKEEIKEKKIELPFISALIQFADYPLLLMFCSFFKKKKKKTKFSREVI